ncbi:MAG TPA: response regulator [Planctomycetota bacterium]|nr:response regulator [Planctomycetota bacterium]
MPHILIIEDDDSLRKMLRLTLAKMGHTVAEAQNGKEGLAIHGKAPADIVLTDLIMPEMEGLETIMRLRRTHPGVKIIAMSGGGRGKAIDYLQAAKWMGAAQVLAKPFSEKDLAAAIEGALKVG